MKTFKKTLALFLSVIMLIGLVPMGAFATETEIPHDCVDAEDDSICDICGKAVPWTVITLAKPEANAVIANDGDTVWYKFVPKVTGSYTFESNLFDADTYGYLYQSDRRTLITKNDDKNEDDYNFIITSQLEANTVYFFAVKFRTSFDTGTIPVILSFEHDCIDEDNNYRCDICSVLFAHLCVDDNNDIICDLCGEIMPHTCADADDDGICNICNKVIWTIITIDDPDNPTIAVIEKGGDMAWFKFVPQFTGNYTFESKLPGGDTKGYIYSADKTTLIAEDDDGGDSQNFRISHLLQGNTVYFFAVKFYRTSAKGEIPLSLTSLHSCVDDNNDYICDLCGEQIPHTCADADANDDFICDICGKIIPHTCVDDDVVDGICDLCHKVLYIIINVGETKTSVLNDDGETYWFRFIPEATGVYVFESHSEGDVEGYLYDADRDSHIFVSFSTSYDDNNFKIQYHLAAGETYYVKAASYDSFTGDVPISLTIDHLCVDENSDYRCDTCRNFIPHECLDTNNDYHCDKCAKTIPHRCIDENVDYICDRCEEVAPHECIDADNDSICDRCGEDVALNLQLNHPRVVFIKEADTSVTYYFTPAVSGTYIIDCISFNDYVVADLYDTVNNSLVESTESIGEKDFYFEGELEAGVRYSLISTLHSAYFGDLSNPRYTIAVSCAHANKTAVAAKEATCFSLAHSDYELCNTCGEKFGFVESGELAEHSFITYSSNNDATCTANGTETASCKYGCGTEDTREEANSKLEHSFTAYTSNNNATCTANGTETASCDYGCGETYTREEANSKLEHSFTAYTSNNNATCTANGTETASCDYGCGETYTRAIPDTKLPHSFVDGACTECEAEDPDYVPPVDPDEPSSTCKHLCHRTGFLKFIWRIFNFFNKLFKINSHCDCGVAHY